jgi:integrase/recombinase XerD
MATVKLFLRKRVNADGTSALVLKVFKDGVPSISTLYNIKASDWDDTKKRVKKSHANSVRLNNFLLKKLAEANDKVLEAQTIDDSVSAKALIKKVKPNSGGSFFKQADVFMKKLKASGDFNEYNASQPRIKHFEDFLGTKNITFPEITVSLLERYKTYLRITRKVGKEERSISERTVLNHVALIRSIFSQAIDDGVVEKKYYPFGKGGVKIKFPKSAKIPLSIEDVQNLENLELKHWNYNHARNLWLLSFYFGGMRASDVFRLKWSDFQFERLHYTMGKNQEPGSLPMDEKVFLILAQYEDDKQSPYDFVFPELKGIKDLNDKFLVEKVINDSVVRIDKFLRKHVAPLAGITVKFTMHIARHTFGDLAGESIPLAMLQKIFRHSSIITTMNYMAAFINKASDDALKTVIGRVKKAQIQPQSNLTVV